MFAYFAKDCIPKILTNLIEENQIEQSDEEKLIKFIDEKSMRTFHENITVVNKEDIAFKTRFSDPTIRFDKLFPTGKKPNKDYFLHKESLIEFFQRGAISLSNSLCVI